MRAPASPIPRVARPVEIHRLVLVDWQAPDAVLDVTCSKGTYIRVLAEDLGQALGGGAHLAALRRTATGGFAVAEAVTLDALEAMDAGARDALLLPAAVLVRDLPSLGLDPVAAGRFRQGAAVACRRLAGGGLRGVRRCRSPRRGRCGARPCAAAPRERRRACAKRWTWLKSKRFSGYNSALCQSQTSLGNRGKTQLSGLGPE